jgi:SAM-dependent methyltransferase
MSPRGLLIAVVGFGVAAGVALSRRARGHASGRHVPGGVLMTDAAAYDRHSRLVFGSLYRPIAADIAAEATQAARILEVGCGPGHLSVAMARDHGLDVTGLDLDPAMIERAQANAAHPSLGDGRRPAFIVGDVAALPFDDGTFDLVVSTFSMHHWADPPAGLAEIDRVLRPGGRALIWDLKPGFRLFHVHAPDPSGHLDGSPLRIVSTRPWRWPWRISFSQRLELAGSAGPPGVQVA